MRKFIPIAVAVTLLGACGVKQKSYESAQAANSALVAALQSGKQREILAVLGTDAEPLVASGDEVQDGLARAEFLRRHAEANTLVDQEDGSKVILVGNDQWPFPYPLVADANQWRFDTSDGAEEIINRRVGSNELGAIQAALAYVDAQREYYSLNPQGDPLLHYAQRLLSTEGKRDGLYFKIEPGERDSPLGVAFALARSEGYLKDEASRSEPFHGYHFRVLKAQGPNARGGAYDYVVRDRMIGGFGLLAYPADYGNSGIMTFIVNHDGVVFSKDLGAETVRLASELAVFDPDSSWTREATL